MGARGYRTLLGRRNNGMSGLFPIQLLYPAIPIPQLHSNPFRIFLRTDKLMILMITVKIGTALMQY